MASLHPSALPNLVLIDVGAPLEECVRRLQSQLAHVEALAAQQQQQHTDINDAGSSPSPSFLLETYYGAFAEGEAAESVALRRRVAQKLRRLCEQHHVDLRTARSVMLPTGDDADAAAEEEKVSLTAATEQPPPSVQHVQHGALAEDEDDLFGWVTQSTTTTTTTSAAAAAAAVRPAEKEAMARRLPAVDEDVVLHRIAAELADMVEQRYRHGEQANDVHQQLLQLRAHTDALLLPKEMKRSDAVATGKSSAQTLSSTQEQGMNDKSVRDAVNTLLSFRPTHTIATEEERSIWQHAWQSVLPSTLSSPLTAAPTLKVGDRIEAVDVAVLAHVNAQRHAAVLHRWAAVRKEYEKVVEGLNRRTAQAALQLEEMERQKP